MQQATPEQVQASEYEKKKQNFITRTFWTFVMIALFFAALFMGHIYMIVIVTAVQIISFKEVIAIANVPSRARQLRFTKSLNWYFLVTVMYYLYGESVIYYFKHIVLVDKMLLPLATHHRFISFILYVIGKSDSVGGNRLLYTPLLLTDCPQALSFSLLPCKLATTDSNSPILLGHTWRSIWLLFRRISS